VTNTDDGKYTLGKSKASATDTAIRARTACTTDSVSLSNSLLARSCISRLGGQVFSDLFVTGVHSCWSQRPLSVLRVPAIIRGLTHATHASAHSYTGAIRLYLGPDRGSARSEVEEHVWGARGSTHVRLTFSCATLSHPHARSARDGLECHRDRLAGSHAASTCGRGNASRASDCTHSYRDVCSSASCVLRLKLDNSLHTATLRTLAVCCEMFPEISGSRFCSMCAHPTPCSYPLEAPGEAIAPDLLARAAEVTNYFPATIPTGT
jgi:hypothetical protein